MVKRSIRQQFGRYLRRATLGTVIALLVLVVSGALWQAVASARDRRTYPPPGQLVTAGDHRLHLHCVGTGGPTVILEASSAGLATDWAWVQQELAPTTRSCAYDRAGRGWSEDGPTPRDARQLTLELHTLLGNAGIDGPYILVGHSAGGLFVRQFAAQYPQEVAGMVLIDAAHPEQATFDPNYSSQLASDRGFTGALSTLSHLGAARLFGVLQDPAPGLPARQGAEYRAQYAAPRYWGSINAELAVREATDAQVAASGGLPGRPLLIVTAGVGSSPAWLAMQTDLLTLSTDSQQRIIAGADHLSLLSDRAFARESSAAIVAVVEAVRGQRPLGASE